MVFKNYDQVADGLIRSCGFFCLPAVYVAIEKHLLICNHVSSEIGETINIPY